MLSKVCSLLLVVLFSLCAKQVTGMAVMSVDIGMEWMKVAVVSPGVPMEIALNKESKRKTPVAVAFYKGERTFGEDAHTVCVRSPSDCYIYFLDLIGKHVDNPVVKLFRERFPYYNIVPDPVRGTVVFKHSDGSLYTPEELIGMLLQKAKEFAENSAGQSITEVVLSVPGYFNQVERKAMLHAAQLSGLKVLQLINDYTAAALSYGIFRTKDFNETAQYIMLYDMGAHSTSAAVVSYQVVKTKEKGYVETHPQMSILGVGYDRTLGGIEMQVRLRDHLAKQFNNMKKTKTDVFTNARAVAKLYKEAGRLKYILSANTEHYAQVEGLLDDIDFKLLVTRDEFESMCSDLFAKVKAPLEQALKHSGLSLDVINQVILVGAGTRVPAVQQALTSIINKELGKSLNTDEAVVLGAAYKAADLSKGFKVKKFITKDAVLFPIQVHFEKEGEEGKSPVKRTLFSLMNPYPQKKILTFNKHQNDFSFTIHHGELEAWPQHETEALGSTALTNVSLKGVNDAVKKHSDGNADPKGIKVHFTMDDSGILSISSVEYIVEKTIQPGESEKDTESAFSKFSSTIGKLFHSATEDKKEEEKPVREESTDDKENSTSSEEASSAPINGTTTEDKDSDAEKEKQQKSSDKAKEQPAKPKITIIREPVITSEEHLAVSLMNEEQILASAKKIQTLNDQDKAKARKEGALNALESGIIETRTSMGDEQLMLLPFATLEETDAITKKCDELSDWMDEEGFSAEASVLEKKLSELKSLTAPVENRYKEHKERPEMLAALDKTLSRSVEFLNTVKNITASFVNGTADNEAATASSLSPYTPVEVEVLENLINSTQTWRDQTVKEQEEMPKSKDPVLTKKMIIEKATAVDREIRYLINKSKNWRPPPVKTGEAETKGAEEPEAESKKPKGKSKNGTSESPPEVSADEESEQKDKESKVEEHAEL